MFKNYFYLIKVCLLSLVVFSCSNDDTLEPTDDDPIVQVSPVNYNLAEFPYQTLSEYNFFKDNMSDLLPVYGVLPYKIISGLFIDYAKAKTFLWMPAGSKASYVNDYSVFDFPEGSVLITTHYFENVLPNQNTKMIETRLLIKKESEWMLVNYVWNEDQTEANFTTDGSYFNLDWLEDGVVRNVNYKVPSYAECFTCHNKFDVIYPIGLKPQNLNHNIAFDDGIQNQLSKWVDFGYLENNYPSNIVSTINWEDDSQPLELRVRSYFDINCAHCHSDEGYCNYRPMRFAFYRTDDQSKMGVCVDADEVFDASLTKIIEPGNPNRSILFYRISTVEESLRMPILARTLKHEEGVQLIEEWINSLNINCE